MSKLLAFAQALIFSFLGCYVIAVLGWSFVTMESFSTDMTLWDAIARVLFLFVWAASCPCVYFAVKD